MHLQDGVLMANGIQSLLGPDKPLSTRELYEQRQRELDPRNYPYRDSFPDTLTGDIGWHLKRDNDIPSSRPQREPSRYLPLMDSLTAFVRSHNPDAPMARIMDEDEIIEELRGLRRRGGLEPTLRATNTIGSYDGLARDIYLEPGRLLIAHGDYMDTTIPHEVFHHMRTGGVKAFPHISKKRDEFGPLDFPRGHGPTDFTANTMTAAWDALRRVEKDPTQPNAMYKHNLINFMIDNYDRYDHRGARGDKELSREDAERTLLFMVGRDPFNIDLGPRIPAFNRKPTLKERVRRGIVSLFGRDK